MKEIVHRSPTVKLSWCLLVILVGLCLFPSFPVLAQEYGLEFAGQPVSKDQRTQLDLKPEGYFSFNENFELTFKIQIRDSETATFGYIARLLDQDGSNIDLIYDSPESQSLHVIYGNSLNYISVADNGPEIYERWTEISLKYNYHDKSLQLNTPDTTITHFDVTFSKNVKILFGRNDTNPVQTTDVPRMNIRDIRIYEKGKLRHHFPLDEITGNEARDLSTNRKALVKNPGWIKFRYHNWSRSFDSYLSGHVAICFEPVNDRVFMVGEDQMKIFSVHKDSIKTISYSERFSELIRGSRIFYDTLRSTLRCYSLKTNTVHYFDFDVLKWIKIVDGPNRPVSFLYHSKFYSGPDSMLYTFGGYGQHKYFKLIQRFDISRNRWDTIKPRGEAFHPRMHAAIGDFENTIYILGGFGSMAGDQIIKPDHYTDLMAYDLKENSFRKLYDYQAPMDELDFAHSMVINGNDRSFYVLATTIFEYDTYLQLLKGNLDNPNLIKLGSKIPYLFHNENSYCDLFFSQNSQELIATTTLTNIEENETKIAVYKLSFPPYIEDQEYEKRKSSPGKALSVILLLLFTAALFIIIRRPGKKSARSEKQPQNSILQTKQKIPANSIRFFGGFQVINKDGVDITKKFTPLLKELFLVIFLHTIKGKGISVPRLTELLWFSMDAKTAKNNRAVNIAKLRHLLSEIESCTLSRTTSYWQVEFDDSIVYNDYWDCIKSVNQKDNFSREDLSQFLSLISKGSLLGNASYEWLDEFKLECSNLLIDCLTHFVEQDQKEADPELMIQLADAILIFDMMHEEAISIKCRSLTKLGKHSLAKEIFAKFTKDYFTLYDEAFEKSFKDIIKNSEERY